MTSATDGARGAGGFGGVHEHVCIPLGRAEGRARGHRGFGGGGGGTGREGAARKGRLEGT